jgi:hypothetical protein
MEDTTSSKLVSSRPLKWDVNMRTAIKRAGLAQQSEPVERVLIEEVDKENIEAFINRAICAWFDKYAPLTPEQNQSEWIVPAPIEKFMTRRYEMGKLAEPTRRTRVVFK